MSENAINNKAMNTGKRKRFHEHGAQNDIKYRGPISYFGFQVLGWLCIVTGIAIVMMKLSIKVNPDMNARFETLVGILEYIPPMSLPFLLIADFSKILNNEEGYKKQIMRNGLAMAGIFVLFNAFFYRYIVGSLKLITVEPEQVMPMLTDMMYLATHYGFMAFNIFVDLFLCTMFMFFLNYRPAKFFTGGKLYLFRAFAILPIAYEIASMVLKAECAQMKIELPVWTFPLLTVKPPMTFFVFVLMALFIKFREMRYCRHGRTHEDYEAFLKTNRNSLHFSIFLTVMLVIAGIADIIILILMAVKQAGSFEALQKIIDTAQEFYPIADAIGFGRSWPLILVAPIMLLYSYTRKPKFPQFAILIPVVAIVLIVFVVIQGGYQILNVANIPRISYLEVKKNITETIQMLMELE
jgi:hypothetical protein